MTKSDIAIVFVLLLLFVGYFVVMGFCVCLFAFFLSLWCYCFGSHFGVIIGPTSFIE